MNIEELVSELFRHEGECWLLAAWNGSRTLNGNFSWPVFVIPCKLLLVA